MPPSADRRVDPVSLTVGLATILLGVLLLLDQTDSVELTFGWLGAAVAALVGAGLLVSGLRDAERGVRPEAEHDREG